MIRIYRLFLLLLVNDQDYIPGGLKLTKFRIWLFTHRKSCEVQKEAWSAVTAVQMSYLMNPNWVNKNGKQRESQSIAYLRNNRTP